MMRRCLTTLLLCRRGHRGEFGVSYDADGGGGIHSWLGKLARAGGDGGLVGYQGWLRGVEKRILKGYELHDVKKNLGRKCRDSVSIVYICFYDFEMEGKSNEY